MSKIFKARTEGALCSEKTIAACLLNAQKSLLSCVTKLACTYMKYPEVYLHQYQTVSEACNGLAKYFLFYNTERLHESLGYQTPYEIYVKERGKINPMQASTIHHI